MVLTLESNFCEYRKISSSLFILTEFNSITLRSQKNGSGGGGRKGGRKIRWNSESGTVQKNETTFYSFWSQWRKCINICLCTNEVVIYEKRKKCWSNIFVTRFEILKNQPPKVFLKNPKNWKGNTSVFNSFYFSPTLTFHFNLQFTRSYFWISKRIFQIQKYDLLNWKLRWNINLRWEINTIENTGVFLSVSRIF